jgi:hypothetical protein
MLSVIAALILCVTTVFDYLKKFTVGPQKDSISITNRSKGYLLKLKRQLSKFSEEIQLEEKNNGLKDEFDDFKLEESSSSDERDSSSEGEEYLDPEGDEDYKND